MIVATQEQIIPQLEHRENVLALFQVPEGMEIFEMNGQRVFPVIAGSGYSGFHSYLMKRSQETCKHTFDPYSLEACRTALKEFEAYLAKR